MTKRDHKLIAEALREAMDSKVISVPDVIHVARVIADKLKEDNERFNRELFMSALIWGEK